MPEYKRRGYWREILVFAAVSIFLYEIGFLSFLFLIPLQVLFLRKGENEFLLASAAVLLGVIITAMIQTRAVEERQLKNALIFLSLCLPVLLTAALYLVNKEFPPLNRVLFKLLVTTGAVGLVSIPVIVLLGRNEAFVSSIHDQLTRVIKMFSGDASGVLFFQVKPEQIINMVKEIFLRDYLFSFFLVLTLNWRIGTGIGRRVTGKPPGSVAFFHLPEKMVWGFLLAWAGIFADIFFGLKAGGYIVWNVGLIFTFLYGIQGIGILRFLLTRSNLTRGMQMFIVVTILVFLFIPVLNFVLIIGIPILGVSEVWIKYRKPKRSDE